MSDKLTESEVKYVNSIDRINGVNKVFVALLVVASIGIVVFCLNMQNYINSNSGKTPNISFEQFKGLVNCLFTLCFLTLNVPAVLLLLKIRSNNKFKIIINKLNS
ncbi:MAG: hypothetical protein KAR32_04440 [Candidatus Omnitrophica bacterium]|nr:hypothetical protein [Candidatus Omnitrophota bacterium]